MSNEEDLKIAETDNYCFSPCVEPPSNQPDVSEIDYIAQQFNRGEITLEEAREMMGRVKNLSEERRLDLDWGKLNE